MRVRDHDSDETGRSHRSQARLDRAAALTLQAAASGRTDVLDRSAVLGLQRTVGNSGVGAVLDEERSPVHDVIGSGGGAPLAPDVRSDMESRLGADFGDVRVHTDQRAHESAQSVSAHAYTVGPNIVFQRDRFDPSSMEGRTTLAHELTHVVQQRTGPVDGTPSAGGISVSDPLDRFEQEAAASAERAVSADPGPASVMAAAPPAVQRQEMTEEDEAAPVQTSVQRQGEAPEEDEDVPT